MRTVQDSWANNFLKLHISDLFFAVFSQPTSMNGNLSSQSQLLQLPCDGTALEVPVTVRPQSRPASNITDLQNQQ